MNRKSRVPQFGNWDYDEKPLYTAYFDQAMQNRHGGKVMNPDDPAEFPDAFVKISSSNQSVAPSKNPEPEQAIGQGVVRHTHASRASKEDGNLRPQMNNYPAPAPEYRGRRLDHNSTEPRNADRVIGPGEAPKRTVRDSVGSDHSIEQLPLHRLNQVRLAGRGSESAPSWGENSSIDGGRGASARPPMRPKYRPQGSGSRGASVSVPRFGDWDVNSTASSDGYTFIFDKVRQERQLSAVMKTPENKMKQSPSTNERRTNTSYKSYKSKNSCLPWCGFFGFHGRQRIS